MTSRRYRLATPFATRFDASLHPRGWLMLPRDEVKDVQPAVIERLTHLGALALPVDAGARALRGRIRGALLSVGRPDLLGRVMTGVSGAAAKGTADVFAVLRGGRAALIECKRPALLDAEGRIVREAGAPTKEQVELLLLALSRGAKVGVAWGPSDVDRIVIGP